MLISIGLDVEYFFVFVKIWNTAFFVGIGHLYCDSYGDGDVTLRQLWWRWCYIVTGAMCVKWTVVIAATQGGATQCYTVLHSATQCYTVQHCATQCYIAPHRGVSEWRGLGPHSRPTFPLNIHQTHILTLPLYWNIQTYDINDIDNQLHIHQ